MRKLEKEENVVREGNFRVHIIISKVVANNDEDQDLVMLLRG